jgi:hypothetical protein
MGGWPSTKGKSHDRPLPCRNRMVGVQTVDTEIVAEWAQVPEIRISLLDLQFAV